MAQSIEDKIGVINRDKMIEAFQVCLLWQDGNLDEHSIYDLDDQLNNDIRDLVDSFVLILNDNELKKLISDPDNFGHWLCLEQMGHGSGFYDSTDPIVSNITNTLESANLYRPADLYVDDNIIYSDFFKYGKSKGS